MENCQSELSTAAAVHFDDTINQSNNPKWFERRKMRVTASNVADCHTKLLTWTIEKLHKPPKNLDNVPHIDWGRKKEAVAILDLAKKLSEKQGKEVQVRECGLFVNKAVPFMAASPDGLVFEGDEMVLVEMKCSFILKEHKPTELEKLEKAQRNRFYCTKTSAGTLRLRRKDRYYRVPVSQPF